MKLQKLPGTQQSSTHVTTTQLTVLLLLLGIAAGVCASLLLRMQDKLRGGEGVHYAFIISGIILCALFVFGFLRSRIKAAKLLLPPKN